MFDEGLAADEEPLEIPRMDAKLAEDIVRKWQSIKSKALGPEHTVTALQEVRTEDQKFDLYSWLVLLLVCPKQSPTYVARDTLGVALEVMLLH